MTQPTGQEAPAVKPARKIAIVGTASSTFHETPYQDQAFEIWGLPWHKYERLDAAFEIHCRALWTGPTFQDHDAYIKKLNGLGVPVYMLEDVPGVERQVGYPVHDVARLFDPDYEPAQLAQRGPFASSIAYMIGLAVYQFTQGEPIDELAVYGVDMLCNDEYAYQRANCDAWLMLARGLGMKVTVPANSALLKYSFVYGIHAPPSELKRGVHSGYLQKRRASFAQQLEVKKRECAHLEGAILELDNLTGFAVHYERGGVIPGADT